MHTTLKIALSLVAAALPVYAQTETAPSGAAGMNCPMMGADMQNGMSAMMTDLRTAMDATNDPAMKARLQGMQERMTAMMANMQNMHGRMGGMMNMKMKMGAGKAAPSVQENAKTAEPPAPNTPGNQEHEGHHPAK